MEKLPEPGLMPPPLTRSARKAAGGRGGGARQQVGLALLAMQRAGRSTLARMRRSRLLLWQFTSPAAEELVLTPPDLRPHDASFLDEITAGNFGLAGAAANLKGRSPFAIDPPSVAWARELHGFGWLRHLEAAETRESRQIAHKLVAEWIRRYGGGGGRHAEHAWPPQVVGRRIVSWLSHAGLLLDGATPKHYTAVMRSLTAQINYLATAWREAPDGLARLVALVGQVHAALCIEGHDRQLAQTQAHLVSELQRQCPVDGGHISRNPLVLVELLLDLLPLRRCLATRGKTPPPALLATIRQMTEMLRHLRLGDGTLARFNGVGAGERDVLASVAGHDDGTPLPAARVRAGYVRLDRAGTVVLVDAGSAPPLVLAGAASAGCLAFELSSGSDLVFVNAGMPGERDAARRAVARGTSCHNTLCLGERSSARLMRDPRLEREAGSPPLSGPSNVTCELAERQGCVELQAGHDGYAEPFGLVHARTLTLDGDGGRLSGRDCLAPAKGVIRFSWDVPFAVHFHLHPEVEARVGPSPEVADLWLPNGELWQFVSSSAALSIEDAVFCAHPLGPQPTLQVVLRGTCYGAAEVTWTLTRVDRSAPAHAAAVKRRGSGLVDRLAAANADSALAGRGRQEP